MILVLAMGKSIAVAALMIWAAAIAARPLHAQGGARAGGPGAALPPPPGQGRGQGSPASVRPPQTATPQQYPAAQIDAGRARFASQCGFCHGRDAGGGESGPDLTRSALVAADVRGDRIIPLLRSRRVDEGMRALTLPDADLTAIVAFIHAPETQAASAARARRR